MYEQIYRTEFNSKFFCSWTKTKQVNELLPCLLDPKRVGGEKRESDRGKDLPVTVRYVAYVCCYKPPSLTYRDTIQGKYLSFKGVFLGRLRVVQRKGSLYHVRTITGPCTNPPESLKVVDGGGGGSSRHLVFIYTYIFLSCPWQRKTRFR